MRASGHYGEVRYGYQVAARTGPWTIVRDETARDFEFTAVLVEVDDVWFAQRPLNLVLTLGQVEWIWRDVEPLVTEGRVTLRLTRRPDVTGPRVA